MDSKERLHIRMYGHKLLRVLSGLRIHIYTHAHAHTYTYATTHIRTFTTSPTNTYKNDTLYQKKSQEIDYNLKSSRVKYWNLVLTRWTKTITTLKGREYAFLPINVSNILNTNLLMKYFKFSYTLIMNNRTIIFHYLTISKIVKKIGLYSWFLKYVYMFSSEYFHCALAFIWSCNAVENQKYFFE